MVHLAGLQSQCMLYTLTMIGPLVGLECRSDQQIQDL